MHYIKTHLSESIQLFHAIWLRLPVIVSGPKEMLNKLLSDLLYYIPDYRKLVLIGDLPKSIFYFKTSPVMLQENDIPFLEENILQLFDEESASDPPVELVGYIEDRRLFYSLLGKVDRGWALFTELPLPEIKNALTLKIDKMTISIMQNKPADTRLEKLLLQKNRYVSEQALRFILQKKMYEIRNAGQAIIQEIEHNRDFTQAEIEEAYEMRSLTFLKMVAVTKCESRLDIQPFIRITPSKVSGKLKMIAQIPGVEMIAVLKEQRVIGLARYNYYEYNPQELFPKINKEIGKMEISGRVPQMFQFKKNAYIVCNSNGYVYYFALSKTYKNETIKAAISKFFTEN